MQILYISLWIVIICHFSGVNILLTPNMLRMNMEKRVPASLSVSPWCWNIQTHTHTHIPPLSVFPWCWNIQSQGLSCPSTCANSVACIYWCIHMPPGRWAHKCYFWVSVLFQDTPVPCPFNVCHGKCAVICLSQCDHWADDWMFMFPQLSLSHNEYKACIFTLPDWLLSSN